MADSTARRAWPQYMVAFLCNMGALNFGLTVGWVSPFQTLLTSTQSPIGRPLSVEEVALIGSIPAIALTLCTPIFGYIVQKAGRKRTLLYGNLPNLVVFLLLLTATDIYTMYVARFLAGFSAAGSLTITSIYVSECSEDHLRGRLGGLSGLFINSGVIIVYALGGFTSYTATNFICISFTLIFLASYFWIPESPADLLRLKDVKNATDAIFKLQGGSRSEIEAEVQAKVKLLEDVPEPSSSLLSVIRDPVARHATFITLGVYFIQQFSGISAILSYNVDILQLSGSAIDPYLAAILSVVNQLLGSITSTILIDKIGRKFLLLFGAVFMTLSHLVFCVYVYLAPGTLFWIPNIAQMVYFFTYALGYGTVPFVLLPELFRSNVRGITSSFIGTIVSLEVFITCFSFPLITQYIGLHGNFIIAAFTCFLGFIFVYINVFETKGKSNEEIQTLLRKKACKGDQKKRVERLEMELQGESVDKVPGDSVGV